MLVSSFELLITRITGGASTPLNRRIIQGYFLSITNLENRDLQLAARFTSSSTGATPANAVRDLIPSPLNGSNTSLFFDNAIPTQNNFQVSLLDFTSIVNGSIGVANSRVFQTPLVSIPSLGINAIPTIRAKQTALLALLPNAALITPANLNPGLEIRGHVELFQLMGFPPAKVLLNAEHRGTFLDNDFSNPNPASPAEQDFDQIAYSIALASGTALNEID